MAKDAGLAYDAVLILQKVCMPVNADRLAWLPCTLWSHKRVFLICRHPVVPESDLQTKALSALQIITLACLYLLL